MPYIKQEERCDIAWGFHELSQKIKEHPGNLNYFITGVLNYYAENNGQKYKTYNEIIGVLECAKLEFYRRMIAPYEDKKIEENGDVY